MDWWHMYNQSHPEYFALQRDGHRGPDVSTQFDRCHLSQSVSRHCNATKCSEQLCVWKVADWGNGKQMWTKMCVSQPALHDQIVKFFVNHTLLEGVGNHSLGVSACEDDFDAGIDLFQVVTLKNIYDQIVNDFVNHTLLEGVGTIRLLPS